MFLEEFFPQYVDEKLAPKTVDRYHEQTAYLDPELLKMLIGEIAPAARADESWKRFAAM